MITDASIDGLGAIIEQVQPDLYARPLYFLSRAMLPNERNWSATEWECAAVKNRQFFHGMPFVAGSDHQPLKNLENNRVQRWLIRSTD